MENSVLNICIALFVYSCVYTFLLGDWVAVTGAAGGLGHLGLQYAKAMGFRTVAVVEK